MLPLMKAAAAMMEDDDLVATPDGIKKAATTACGVNNVNANAAEKTAFMVEILMMMMLMIVTHVSCARTDTKFF